ncbi:MAG: HlyC/CorC family transporter [Candidatus Melainabacteria bacterium]|nr:MAG: HlyC/CorC family transporter [Candidatus Melainabacteria bacterium]
MFELTVILFLIGCNALFVASEFATVVAPKQSIEKRALDGDKTAQQIIAVIKEPARQDRYIAASQVGITIASLALGMYGEEVIAHWLSYQLSATGMVEITAVHLAASVTALVFLTYIHVVLGEIVPKSLALQKSELVMFLLIRPMLFFMSLFKPIIFVLNGLNTFLLKTFFGIDRSKSSVPAFSADEIQLILQESETEGIISDEIGTVIQQMFDFGELVAEDIMVPRVHVTALPVRPTREMVRDCIRTATHSRFPVYAEDKDNIIGVVHIKDLAALLEEYNEGALTINAVPFVPLSSPLKTVLESMREYRTHMAVVLDEYGGTAGIISTDDIFEEVIGEIDESITRHKIEELENGTLRVDGTVHLYELEEYLEISMEEETIETLSGLVLDRLQRPPRVGDNFKYKNLTIAVSKVKGRGAHTCIIRTSGRQENEKN